MFVHFVATWPICYVTIISSLNMVNCWKHANYEKISTFRNVYWNRQHVGVKKSGKGRPESNNVCFLQGLLRKVDVCIYFF